MSDTDVAPATGTAGSANGAASTPKSESCPIKAERLLERLFDELSDRNACGATDVAAAAGLLTNSNLVSLASSLAALFEQQREQLAVSREVLAELKKINSSLDDEAIDDTATDELLAAVGAREVPGA